MKKIKDQPEKIKLSTWKKLIKIIAEEKKLIILLVISTLVLAGLDLLFPLLNRYSIDTFFGDNPQFEYQWYFLGAYMLISVLFGITVFLFIRFAGMLEARTAHNLRKRAFEKVQLLSYDYFDKTPAGWIVSRLTSDAKRLSRIISWGLVNGLWGLGSMIGILGVMFVVKWQLALILLAFLPTMLLVSMYFRKRILKSYRQVRKINSEITASYNEGIMGNKTSKTLVLEDYNMGEFNELTTDMKQKTIRAVLYSSIFFPVLLVFSFAAILVLLGVGGNLVLNDLLTVSTLYLFISYTLHFFDPVMSLANVLSEMQQAQAAAERVIGLIEEVPTIKDSLEVEEKYGTMLEPNENEFKEIKGDVVFKDVTFSYIDNEIILDNFNLDIKAGMSVGLVGATGSGKSTIVNLVCRFYEPNTGQVLIDGVDYREISLNNLRSNLGYVLQSPHLFNLSVLDNIRFGNKEATLEEVIEVSKIVGAHEFIMRLENGYDTLVGEEGSLLSTGERQLVSFARALLVDPKILVLDEATSSIDTKTEEAILEAIDKVMSGRTTFIVAHRLSTIKEVDKILVIDNGKIIESGTHEELMALEKEYFNLYKNQFINQEIIKTIG